MVNWSLDQEDIFGWSGKGAVIDFISAITQVRQKPGLTWNIPTRLKTLSVRDFEKKKFIDNCWFNEKHQMQVNNWM